MASQHLIANIAGNDGHLQNRFVAFFKKKKKNLKD